MNEYVFVNLYLYLGTGYDELVDKDALGREERGVMGGNSGGGLVWLALLLRRVLGGGGHGEDGVEAEPAPRAEERGVMGTVEEGWDNIRGYYSYFS